MLIFCLLVRLTKLDIVSIYFIYVNEDYMFRSPTTMNLIEILKKLIFYFLFFYFFG